MGGPWENFAPTSTGEASGPWNNFKPKLQQEMKDSSGLGLLGEAATAYDNYWSGPVRDGITKLAQTGSPSEALSEYKNQVGKKSHVSGKEQAIALGLTDKSDPNSLGLNPAAVGGQVLEAIQDPLFLSEQAATKTRKILGPAFQKAKSLIPESVSGFSKSMSNGAGKLTAPITDAIASAAGGFTGIPSSQIKTYASETDDINRLIRDHAGQSRSMIDAAREELLNHIQSAKAASNDAIGLALNHSSPEKVYSTRFIVDQLEAAKQKLNSVKSPDGIAQINALINQVKELPNGSVRSLVDEGIQSQAGQSVGSVAKTVGGGSSTTYGPTQAPANLNDMASLKDMHDIKEILSEVAYGTGNKQGTIFNYSSDASKAASEAAKSVKETLEKVAPSGYAEANKHLSELHELEDRLKSGVTSVDAQGGGFMSQQNADLSKKLKSSTGYDLPNEQQKIRTAGTFANAGIMSGDTTGKGGERMAKAGIVGYGLGKMLTSLPLSGEIGAGALALVSSPKVVKEAINTGRIPIDFVKYVTGGTAVNESTLFKIYQFANTVPGMTLLQDFRSKRSPMEKRLEAKSQK
jgi:hypothetical protein